MEPAQPGVTPDEMRQQSRSWWERHNRSCRRELTRRGFTPDDPAHLDECRCNWPFLVFDTGGQAGKP